MDDQNLPEDQNQENIENTPTEASEPEARTFQSDVIRAPREKKSRKKLVLTILILLLIAGGAAAFLLLGKKDTPAPAPAATPAAQTPQPAAQTANSYLVAKTDKKVTVSQLGTDGKMTELLSYDEDFAVSEEEGSDYTSFFASAALSPDGKKIAYIEKDNLKVFDIATKKSKTVVSAKKTNPDAESELEREALELDPSVKLQGGPGGVFSVGGPAWSSDQTHISFYLGQYEGSSSVAINLETKKYVFPKDSFRYVDEKPVKNSFTIVKQDVLIKSGFLPEYLISEYATVRDIAFDGQDSLLAILCAVDQPDSGNSQYLPDAFSADLKYRRDCGEPAGNALVRISLKDGKYQTLIKSGVQTDIAQKDGDIYTVAQDKDKLQISVVEDAKTAAAVTLPAELSAKKLDGLDVSAQDGVILATVYYVDDAKRFGAVVDVLGNKVLHTQEIPKGSRLSVLK